MRSCILVAAVAASELVDGAIVTWYEPADGVPLSGLESAQACALNGQRLCYYDELCPSGEDSQPVGMPSSHSSWMPFLSTTYGRRWMHGGCKVHEDLYDEDCYVDGCGTSPCANECCDHAWCTTPGYDNCQGATQGSFNGYTESCKGSYACCRPACCVEHSYWGNGEVNGTTCYAGRSPWDAATMTDLCTAGYSEAGEVAPPFRDCRQEAIDSGNCGTGDWDTCAECVDHNVGSYFANVGYASCPDWVVDAMNAEGAAGGQCAAWTLGYENACREWGYPKEGEWNVDENCCAGKKQMACADGYRLENTGNVCNKDCTAYDYHCIACDPASDCMGNLDEKGEDYFCDSHLILVICLPIGVVLICIGCCICHSRRQAQQRQAQAAANAQMAHVQMAPVPTSYAYNTQQPVVQGAIVGKQQPVLEGVVVPSAPPIEPKAEEMYNQIAAWYNAPENAALRATWGAYPEPDEFQTWPGFVAVTNAFLDREALEEMPPPWAPPAEEMPWAPPAEEMPPPAPPRSFCSACGAPVQGPFCGQCGARA